MVRKPLPSTEQMLASNKVQVGRRFMEIALSLELPYEAEGAHHRCVRRTGELGGVPIPPPRRREKCFGQFRGDQNLQHPLIQVGEHDERRRS